VLQQEVYISDFQGQEPTSHDEQLWGPQYFPQVQDSSVQVPGLVRKAITNIICLKNLIKCYRVTSDSEIDTTFVVHCSAFGLPDLLFEMHPCGLHVCYPKKIGQFGFVQTVEDNMKLFSKRQVAGARKVRELYKKLIYPLTADFRAIVSAGGDPGSDVTLDDVKAAEVIWGRSVLKLKGNMTRSNAKRTVQSIVKVPNELITLHYEVELAIDCFFVNKHVFFTTYSTKICFTTVTHLSNWTKEVIWAAMNGTYKVQDVSFTRPQYCGD
jgi:hypothetical protein